LRRARSPNIRVGDEREQISEFSFHFCCDYFFLQKINQNLINFVDLARAPPRAGFMATPSPSSPPAAAPEGQPKPAQPAPPAALISPWIKVRFLLPPFISAK
jgi:hypothetical protein